MQLEVGKDYRSRDGKKVLIVRHDGMRDDQYPFISHHDNGYLPNGRYFSNTIEDPDDLIDIWDDKGFDVVSPQPDALCKPGLDAQGRGKLDAGKERFDLLPPEAMFALAELLGKGAIKYADHAWEKGMKWSRCFAALMRHAWKFWRGEDFDEETGAHHMVAVACNAFFIYTYFVRGIGEDDRVKKESK